MNLVINKMLHRHSHKILHVDNMQDTKSVKSTVFLMKKYNEGRHGSWNNYVCFKGIPIQSYIYKTQSYLDEKKKEQAYMKSKGLDDPSLSTPIGC